MSCSSTAFSSSRGTTNAPIAEGAGGETIGTSAGRKGIGELDQPPWGTLPLLIAIPMRRCAHPRLGARIPGRGLIERKRATNVPMPVSVSRKHCLEDG